MGNYFNAPIDSIQWPQSLQSLTFSDAFNQPLESVRLPDSVTYVRLGYCYDHPLERVKWPSSLTCLDLHGRFSQPLREWTLPHSLTHLAIQTSQWIHGPSQLRLPANLRTLTLPLQCNVSRESLNLLHLPSSIHTLTLGGAMVGSDLAALKSLMHSRRSTLDFPVMPHWMTSPALHS